MASLTHVERTVPRARSRGVVAMLGPAFVAAVAYIDPGNFATNIAGGAKYGYMLVWVIVVANLMAMLVQYLSAKTGVATGRNLPELCREHFPKPVTFGLWLQAEAIAIATDLAEFVGAAIALNLLFGVPPFAAGLMTAVVAFAILELQTRGYRRFELAIAGFLGIVLFGFAYNLLQAGADPGAFAAGLIPHFDGTDSVLLAVGILGATVMPHVVYLHSALQRPLGRRHRRQARDPALPAPRRDPRDGPRRSDQPVDARRRGPALNGTPAWTRSRARTRASTRSSAAARRSRSPSRCWRVACRSSSVGTYAGQVVMQGFINRRIPLFARRAITMAPSLVVLGIGVDPSMTLVISQVVLSFGIPFALVPMVLLTRRADIMGALVNRRATTAAASVVAALIIGLNSFLLYQTFFT